MPSNWRLSVGPLAAQDAHRRPPEKLDVGFEALVAHVPEVHASPFLKADIAASTDLPEARQARLYRQATKLPGSEAGHFADVQRARTDERHLPKEDVEQLRRFIEARFSQDAAQASDPRVAAILEDGARALIGDRVLDLVGIQRMVRNLTIMKVLPRWPARRCQNNGLPRVVIASTMSNVNNSGDRTKIKTAAPKMSSNRLATW